MAWFYIRPSYLSSPSSTTPQSSQKPPLVRFSSVQILAIVFWIILLFMNNKSEQWLIGLQFWFAVWNANVFQTLTSMKFHQHKGHGNPVSTHTIFGSLVNQLVDGYSIRVSPLPPSRPRQWSPTGRTRKRGKKSARSGKTAAAALKLWKHWMEQSTKAARGLIQYNAEGIGYWDVVGRSQPVVTITDNFYWQARQSMDDIWSLSSPWE